MAGKKGNDKKDAEGKGGKGGKGKGKGEEVVPDVAKPKVAQAIIVRHIICEKFSKKEEAMAKLKAGETWQSVANEYATEKAKSGGALGRKVRGELVPEFETVAFELPAFDDWKEGSREYPYGDVKSVFGYHIIRVDKREY